MTKITIDRTVVEQALGALEGGADSWQRVGPAIDALKAALAEPAQEPVKQCMAHGECFGGECIYQRPAEPVQEPAKFLDVVTYTGTGVNCAALADHDRAWYTIDEINAKFDSKPVQQGCAHCNHPLYAATKCRVCGRVTEVVQEPVAGVVLNEEGRAALVEHGREEWHCVVRNARRLYTAPPQRKPLSEEEIFKIENDIPDDVISDRAWTIWFARAIERAHGIKE